MLICLAALLAVLGGPMQGSAQAGTTELVSVATVGTQANDPSAIPSISADGLYVAFQSTASNLVPGDTNSEVDVFLRDRQQGTTTRVSVASNGRQGNGRSSHPSISADGRYVAFESVASNLVSEDSNAYSDIFVYERETRRTTRVSVASDAAQANNHSEHPSISADGRYVAFASAATNLVPGGTSGVWHVFVHDRQTQETTYVSQACVGAPGTGGGRNPSISADGRYVAFESSWPYLVPGDTNGQWDVFVRDRQEGTTTRVSVASDGTEANGYCWWASISANGRYVAFVSKATNLVAPGGSGLQNIYVRDLDRGQTTRVSVYASGGAAPRDCYNPSISAYGRYVAFHTEAPLVWEDGNNCSDVFVRDRQMGQTTLVSLAPAGVQANDQSKSPSISADGRYVAFASAATNLVPGDSNNFHDIFVRAMSDITPEPSATPLPSPTALPSATGMPTATRTATRVPTATPRPAATPTATPTAEAPALFLPTVLRRC